MDRVAADHVGGFEIVSDPDPLQLKKLEMLRAYAHLTTGAAIRRDYREKERRGEIYYVD